MSIATSASTDTVNSGSVSAQSSERATSRSRGRSVSSQYCCPSALKITALIVGGVLILGGAAIIAGLTFKIALLAPVTNFLTANITYIGSLIASVALMAIGGGLVYYGTLKVQSATAPASSSASSSSSSSATSSDGPATGSSSASEDDSISSTGPIRPRPRALSDEKSSIGLKGASSDNPSSNTLPPVTTENG